MKKLKLLPILLVLIAVGCSQGVDYSYSESDTNDSQSRAVTVNKPFPQGLTIDGLLKPNVSQDVMKSQIESYYDQWKERYVKPLVFTNGAVDTQGGTGIVIDGDANGKGWNWDKDELSISTSEAHGWGMIIFALMAGHDNQAKDYFDKMYKIKVNYPSKNSSNLMSWIIPARGDFSIQQQANATDGDMDIAYALLLADKQWGGSPAGYTETYKEAAIRMITDLAELNILEGTGIHFPRLANSDDEWADVREWKVTRPSDFMIGHMDIFSEVTTGETSQKWKDVMDITIKIVNHIQSEYSNKTGLMPEFLGNKDKDFSKKIGAYKGFSDEWEGKKDDVFFYNASRFPWRYSMGYIRTKNAEVKASMDKLNSWVVSNHQTNNKYDPEKTCAGYTLSGTRNESYNSRNVKAGFMAGLAVSDDRESLTKAWENTSDFITSTEYKYYYENSMSLLTMLYVSGNWWCPLGNDPTIDTEPPTVPKSFEINLYQNYDLCQIDWHSSTDNVELAGYELIVKPSWGQERKLIIPPSGYPYYNRYTIIEKVVNGGTIEATICAIDTSGNKSATVSKYSIVDWKYPPIPSNVRGTYSNGEVLIEWGSSGRYMDYSLVVRTPNNTTGRPYIAKTFRDRYSYTFKPYSVYDYFDVQLLATNTAGIKSKYSKMVRIYRQDQPVIPEDPAATGIPTAPSLSKNNWNGDPNYKVTSNMYWGNNATVLKLYENDILIETKEPSFNSPSAQKMEFSFTGKSIGTYKYKVEAINQHGTTTSSELTVNVTH